MQYYVRMLVGGAAALVASAASAVVLDPGLNKADKPLQKHRADVAKQVGKYTACVTKALIKCELKGADSGVECDVANPPASTIADAAAKQKFIDALAKCESKLDFTKKGPASDYSEVGCPGDADPGTTGDQPYPSYTEMQAGVPASIAVAIAPITPVLQAFCGGAPPTADETVLDCQTTGAKALSKYTAGIVNCQQKCENDYKDKKGNGGPTDSTTQCGVGVSTDTNFNACVTKVQTKAEAKIPVGDLTLMEFQGLEGAVNTAVNDSINDGYNENDCP